MAGNSWQIWLDALRQYLEIYIFIGKIAAPYIVLIVAVCIIVYAVRRILRSPFCYPYFDQSFDVSGKRNVDINNYIDRFLCDDENWHSILDHWNEIQRWKHEQEIHLQTCILKKRRTRQYHEAIDDKGAFRFTTIRDQTRYRQSNYIRTAYKVSVSDSQQSVSYQWLVERHSKLAEIGFECTLKEYHAKDQRKRMTPKLRRKIMERDHYTCQICGKRMPDGVGLQIDHIVPVSKGGKSVPSNLRVLCSKCNGRKGALM